LRRMQWLASTGKDTLATRTFTDARRLAVTDSLRHVFTATGAQSMFTVVTDEAGTVWVDTLSVWIPGAVAATGPAREAAR